MTTYIYQKDSTLWAFEGPEKPHCLDDAIDWKKYDKQISTARESALPVVNAEVIVNKHYDGKFYYGSCDYGSVPVPVELKPGETVALPGWGLEKVEYCNHDCCQNDNQCVSCQKPYWKYRLVRSEPDGIEMNHAVVDEFTKPIPIKLTFKSGSLWYGEYEVVNPEVIPITPDGYSTRIKDGEWFTLPDGYGIDTHSHLDGNWKGATITLPEKPENCNHTFDVQSTDGYRRCMWCGIKEITLEKPENSAHGYTEGADYIPTDCAGDRIPTITTVEPSESQEEMMRELFQRLYDCLERGQGTLQNITTDFTITRK